MGNICTISIDASDKINIFDVVDILSYNNWSVTQKNSSDVHLVLDPTFLDKEVINIHDFLIMSTKNQSSAAQSHLIKNHNKKIAGCYLFKENLSISFVTFEGSSSILFFVDDLTKKTIENSEICTFDFAIAEVVMPFSQKGIYISRFSCEQDFS